MVSGKKKTHKINTKRKKKIMINKPAKEEFRKVDSLVSLV